MSVHFSSACAMAECSCLHPCADEKLLRGLAGGASRVLVHSGKEPDSLVIQGKGGCDCQMTLLPGGVIMDRFAPDPGRLAAAWFAHLLAARLLNLDALLAVVPLRHFLLGFDCPLDPAPEGCHCLDRASTDDRVQQAVVRSPERLLEPAAAHDVAGTLDYQSAQIPNPTDGDAQMWESLVARWLRLTRTESGASTATTPGSLRQSIVEVLPRLAGHPKVELARRLAQEQVGPLERRQAAAYFSRKRIRLRHPLEVHEQTVLHALHGGLAGSVWFRREESRAVQKARRPSQEAIRDFRLRKANIAMVDDCFHVLGSRRLPRDKMPQIPPEQIGRFLKFVRSQDVEVTRDLEIPASLIMATQQDMDPDKVRSNDSDEPVLVSMENRILDGHHRWAHKLMKSESVRAIKIHADIGRCLNLARKFLQMEEANEGSVKKKEKRLNSRERLDRRQEKSDRQMALRFADDWSASYLDLGLYDDGRVEFALGMPSSGNLRPFDPDGLGNDGVGPETPYGWDEVVDRVVLVLARRFQRSFGDPERKAARDALAALNTEQAVTVYRRLVGGGKRPTSPREAGEMLYRALGRSDRYVGEDEPENIRQLLRGWKDGRKHVRGLIREGRNSHLMRRSFQDAWKGVNQALKQILAIPGRLDGTTTDEDMPVLINYQEAFREASRQADLLRRDLEKNADESRQKLIEMLVSDFPCVWQISYRGAAEASPDVIKALAWIRRLASRREGERGEIRVRIHLDPTCQRGYYEANDLNPALVTIGPMDTAMSLCHLLGHVLEDQLPIAAGICRAFLRYRCRGERATDMGMLDGGSALAGEMGRLDTFDSCFYGTDSFYVGKVNHSGATEVLAMGLQALWDDPCTFARNDPEYALLMLGILKGDLRLPKSKPDQKRPDRDGPGQDKDEKDGGRDDGR